VVIPADRGHQQSGERAGHDASGRIAGPAECSGREQPHDEGDGRDRYPDRLACCDASSEPGDEALQRLVALPADKARPAALDEQSVQPPGPGVGWPDGKPNGDGCDEGSGGHSGVPVPPGQQQVGDEDQRHQLDTGRDPDASAFPPAPVWLAQIPHNQRHQQQLDLAEIKGALDWLGPEQHPGQQQHAADRGEPDPIAKSPERHPDRSEERQDVEDDGQRLQDAPRRQCEKRERYRREWGVGELQPVPGPVVQRGGEPGPVAGRELRDHVAAEPVDV